jgi:hypothetical protein
LEIGKSENECGLCCAIQTRRGTAPRARLTIKGIDVDQDFEFDVQLRSVSQFDVDRVIRTNRRCRCHPHDVSTRDFHLRRHSPHVNAFDP